MNTVITPVQLKTLLDARQPRVVILETSWAKADDAKEYRTGHLPGALHLNTDELENGYPRWLLRPVGELHSVIGAHGITPATTVIVYSHQTIAAARVWWVLSYAGVADVRLLDGGFAAWKAAGYSVETKVNVPEPVRFSAKPRTEWLATAAYVSARLNNPQARLGDVRSRDEFIGAKSGYDYIDFKGRIPGAVALGDADDAALLYVNSDGTLRKPEEIAALWQQAGLANAGRMDDGREVIFYCGSGWRSSLAFLYAHWLGYERIRNYSDGWSGWSTQYVPDKNAKGATPGWRQQRTNRPIETGNKP
ncbi:MAG TPA: rhodanese-like domain-containing protein [Blastocatellia bacterium]|nr:rhodanese-like domain-containing protein [Blastocatellia bacterium]HMV86934.1 rhodanese-like domain-containing protein [Blastocatellia bacterium]HMX25968.1 rhodanese-like domain-containing protein [Blastocatellia bacterium]HMZ22473.1 rhodanese-like domain-containing protein [Blastocatellia bacterium]HNG33250.1 rhodanese-like domain-containing protein [Blastocatellia bacterium]